MRRRCRVALSAEYMVWFEVKLMFVRQVDNNGVVSIVCLHFISADFISCPGVERKGRHYSVVTVLNSDGTIDAQTL